MGDRAQASEQERRYLEAADAFGPALERLARAYERDADTLALFTPPLLRRQRSRPPLGRLTSTSSP